MAKLKFKSNEQVMRKWLADAHALDIAIFRMFAVKMLEDSLSEQGIETINKEFPPNALIPADVVIPALKRIQNAIEWKND